MTRRGVFGVLAGGLALLLSGCGIGSKSTYRFRLTVEVDTPEGTRSGSSVYEVMARNMPGMDPSGMVREWKVRGEAVAIDLPGGEVLFALLKTVNPTGHDDLAYSSMAALDPAFNYDYVESARRIANGAGIRSSTELSPRDYPMLVTFRDIADPKTVERVDPTNFPATFGSGVRLKRITVEVTDDAVTSGIEKRLPSYGAETGFDEWYKNLPYGDPRAISRSDFNGIPGT